MQLLRLSDVDAKTGKPVTSGHVPFFALDTLLQFARFEQVPEVDKEAVRQRFFWALDHNDLGICTLGERAGHYLAHNYLLWGDVERHHCVALNLPFHISWLADT